MRLTLISPEGRNAREHAVLGALFEAGLEQYRLRKPGWSRDELRAWIKRTPAAHRTHIVLHGAAHHDLVAEYGLGGRHWNTTDLADVPPGRLPAEVTRPAASASAIADGSREPVPSPMGITSCACHDLDALAAALGGFDEVLVGPVFASLSKPGHGPSPDLHYNRLSTRLHARDLTGWRTAVYALGGITVERIPACALLGFDGIAVLGAIWQAKDPVAAFIELRDRLVEFGP